MATIEKRVNKDGSFSFRTCIRKKGVHIYKTFFTEEDAKLFSFYKERLIDNIEGFEVPLYERVTLKSIFELKANSLENPDRRALDELSLAHDRISQYLPNKNFVHEFSYEDWLNATKSLMNIKVYRGGKTKNCERNISVKSLRRVLANASSSFSYAISKGLNIENYPLKIIQNFINPMLKDNQDQTPLP